MVEPLLPLDGLRVEAAGLELPGEIARFLAERPCGLARALGVKPIELVGERALLGRERAQLVEHRLSARAGEPE